MQLNIHNYHTTIKTLQTKILPSMDLAKQKLYVVIKLYLFLFFIY